MTASVKAVLLTTILIGGIFTAPAFSQTLKDFFNSSETPSVYLGVDFTKAKLIDESTANEMDIRDRLYGAINELVINEPKKYDLNKAFHKTNVDHDLSLVAKRNLKVDAGQIKSSNGADFARFKESDIADLIKGFDFGGKTGIGILFVMEGMSKTAKAASVWVTFVDMKAKKVLLTERMEEKAAGFGFRNYWAGAIKNVLDDIEDKRYKQWKNKFQ
jgi:hypothetical protein